jgi:tetratricopeptide (TPR) repeat protein
VSATFGSAPQPDADASRRGIRPRRLRVLVAALLLPLVLWGAGPRAARAEDDPLERARAFLRRGRLYPAEQAAREAIARDPDDATAHRLFGEILLRRRKPEASIEALLRARELDSALPGVDALLADAWLLAGEEQRACEAAARALAQTPEDARLLLRRSECAERRGDLDAAETDLRAAAEDPDYAQIALYRLGLVLARAGRRDAAAEAFERAVFLDPPSPIATRAWAEVQALEHVERSWSLSAGAGMVFDDEVTRPEVDFSTGRPDQAGQLELEGTWQPPLPEGWPDLELELGYGLLQTLYVDTSELNLQSHAMSASLRRKLGPGSASLSYLYSLNTLGGDRFLDLQDLRPSYGFALRPTWYTTFGPALQVKRFEQSADRDALGGAFGTLQLVDLSGGSWGRYLLFGVDGEIEDADGRQFDWRGFSAQAALHWVWTLGERVVPFDLRYRYRLRDYLNDTTLVAGTAMAPPVTTSRRDSIHSVRARASHELYRFASPSVGVGVELEYQFEDASSDIPSADYTQNVVTLMLRFSL